MSNAKISQLPSGTTTSGTEPVPIVQAGVTVQVPLSSMTLASTTVGVARATTLYTLFPSTWGTPLLASGDVSGATDSANFIAAINLAATSAQTVPTATDKCGTAVITLGPGTFYINQPNTLMGSSTLAAKLRGLQLIGQGQNITRIVYVGSVSPFMTNNRWQNINFIDIGFSTQVANIDFMWSQELGGTTNIQQFNYVRCLWSGWNNDFFLTGGNNNSEWAWDTCVFLMTGANVLYVPGVQTGTVTASTVNIAVANFPQVFTVGQSLSNTSTLGNIPSGTLYVVATTTTTIQISATQGGAAITPSNSGSVTLTPGSDQFLNFNFHNCKYDPGTSNAPWVNLALGGHVSFSGTTDVSQWVPTVDTYLINLLGATHSQGVCSFTCQKLRVEHGTDHALLLHTLWPQGCISFNQYDGSSQVGSRAVTVNYVKVENVNTIGATMVFRDSMLPGQHNYVYNSNNFNFQQSVTYENCILLQNPSAQQSPGTLSFITQSGSNTGGLPVIDFINTRNTLNATTVGYHEIVDTSLNWHLSAAGAVATPKTVNVVGAQSGGPVNGGKISVRLPLNALITDIRLVKTVASGATGAFSITAQTQEGSPTVFGALTGVNSNLAQTVALTPPYFQCTSDTARTIDFTDTQTRSTAYGGFVLMLTYTG